MSCLDQGCRSLLSIGGDNLQFYPSFVLFSTLAGMNLDHDFVHVSKLSEDQKKVFTENGTLLSSNSSGHLRSDTHQSQIIGGGCRCRPYSNYRGDTVKLLRGYIPPGFGTPGLDPSPHSFCMHHSSFWRYVTAVASRSKLELSRILRARDLNLWSHAFETDALLLGQLNCITQKSKMIFTIA